METTEILSSDRRANDPDVTPQYRPLADSHYRSILKSITWRIIAAFITSLIAWSMTRRFSLAAAIGLGDGFIKIGVFYLHERLWNRIDLGRVKPEPEYEI